VYERLRSFAGLTLLIPNLVAVIGAADRYLGMLATVLGDFDAAHRHFEDAIALESSLASPPLLARTRYWFARMLLVRAAPGDRERARELLRESSASAEALGMTALARDARELLRPPLPGGLAYTGVFVGRDDAFAELRTAWNAVKSGGLRTVLIAGEPGIGKTRLGAEIARAAHREGATVLYGRCDEGLAAAYQPFAEALRAYAAAEPDLAAELGPRAAALARILPDLETGDAASPRPTDPESERLLLFEAVERALAIAARTNPAVLVLDDLHWAAQPTLLLLRHLLRAATDVPLLVVGTYRDTELDRRHPLGAVLADLRRETGVHRVKLGGLDEAAIADLLQAAGSDEERGGLAHAVYERTDGNPFFVGEVLRELVETGWTSDLGLPEGVKEIIGRRLDKVSAAANTALEVASVAGAEFSLALLESVPEAGAADGLLDALDEAVRAGLLTETPSGYAFGHALVRQTLYESLSSARRMRLHRHVGEALEATGADASVLAYHFAEAALDGQIEKAADYANAAATEAIERLAFEDALDLTARAIAVLGLAPDVDHARRGRLVATKATALFAVGELEEPQRLAVRAAQDARTAGSVELLVEAAILSTATLLGTPVPGALDLLEEALDALPSDDVKYRPRLLARIAHYRAWALSEGEAARPYFEEAIRSARDSEQTDVLFLAIEAASRALEGTPLIEERRALADEAIAIADRMWPDGGPMLLGIGTAYLPAAMRSDRIDLCMIVGDRAGATDALDEMKAVVDRFASSGRRYMPEPRTRRFVSGSLYLQDTQAAFLDGSFDQARELIDLRAEESSDAGLVVTGAQRIWLDWEVGNVERQIPLIEAFLEQLPGIVSARALLAGFHAVLGDVSRATEIARELHAEDLAVIPRDAAYPAALAFLAETSARVGDESAAATLARHLRPWAGLALLIPDMVAVIGAADRFRGMLATVMRRFAEAQRHFEDAIEFETRLESPPLLARTRYWYARMLLQRADPASRARADGLLDEALKAANELGMAGLVAEIGDLTR
jgi:tetratricopeptide (TPR) repeat protein